MSGRQRLTPELLRLAYAQTYFPMPDPDTQEILWYSPDPRAIFPLNNFKVSRSLMRSLRHRNYEVTFNRDFAQVIAACADRPETWINGEISQAFTELHRQGDAHSVEVWLDNKLVGGLYGVSLGGAFFAESKFHRERDASKVALYHLVKRMQARGMTLLEVQFLTPHLASLGATNVAADHYKELLSAALMKNVRFS